MLPVRFVSRVRRKFNIVAHNLTQQASSLVYYNRWFDPVPGYVVELALQDNVNISQE
jgi:hypothetical protein